MKQNGGGARCVPVSDWLPRSRCGPKMGSVSLRAATALRALRLLAPKPIAEPRPIVFAGVCQRLDQTDRAFHLGTQWIEE